MKVLVFRGHVSQRPTRQTFIAELFCATFASALLLASTTAEAQVTTKNVVVMGKQSGKCLRVAGGSLAAGSRIVQSSCNESTGSRWALKPQAGGSSPHVLVVGGDSGKCLAVAGGSTAIEADVVQNDCSGVDSQLWSVEKIGLYYRFVAKHSGKCLNVQYGSVTSGASLVQWPCEGNDNEYWSFSEGFLGTDHYSRLVSDATNYCADIQYGSTAEGAAVIQWICKPDAALNQQWALRRSSDGYQLRVSATGKCLAPDAGSTAAGTAMVQVTCGTALSQVWSLTASGSTYALVNKASRLCLDIGGDQSSMGAYLVQNACTGAASQDWRLNRQWEVGSWSDRVGLPLVPAAAAALRNNKILFWAGYDAYDWATDTNYTKTLLYDLASNTAGSLVTVSNTGHDFFCPGTALLADGRLLVNGGATRERTSLYDPVANAWSRSGDMKVPRGYNANAVTSSGRVFTIGGSWPGYNGQDKNGELWSSSSGVWTSLAGIPSTPMIGADPYGPYRGDNHAWLFGTASGRVFHAGPSVQMNWFDTSGSGSYTSAGNRGTSAYAMNGNAIMYDVSRILTVGGAPAYDYATATTSAYTIDIRSGVKVAQTGSMTYPRSFANSVVLPDGTVFVSGGQAYAAVFTDGTAALPGELWNPSTGSFDLMAAASIPRTYHSVSILLPDARVAVAGGGLCGTCDTNHADLEFYSPGYLFTPSGVAAARPEITSAPTTATYNAQINVTASGGVTRFALVRMGSVTHSINNDQRRIPVTISSQSGTSFTLRTPSGAGIATPGYYMLFGIDESGVPSKAAIIKIG
jgi:galactose oxidase